MSFADIGFLDLYIDLSGDNPARMRPLFSGGSKQALVFVPVEYLDEVEKNY